MSLRGKIRALRRGGSGGLRRVHFLHIGKTAGTQIGDVIGQINEASPSLRLEKCAHDTRLDDLPQEEGYFFSIRRPEGRFRSGFYSRKRGGRPRYENDWNPHERIAFDVFEHAGDLAEALFEEGERGRLAFGAMKGMGHVRKNQTAWFDFSGYFLERRPPVWIIRQEHFDADLATFLARLPYTGKVTLSRDMGVSHASDYSGAPPMSEKALGNLRQWYAQDYEFYRRCCEWMEANA